MNNINVEIYFFYKGNDFSNDIKIVVNEMKQKLDKLLTASYSIKKIDTLNI